MHGRAAAAREAVRLRAGTPAARPSSARPSASGAVAAGGCGESISDLVASFGVSRAAIYRALQGIDPPPRGRTGHASLQGGRCLPIVSGRRSWQESFGLCLSARLAAIDRGGVSQCEMCGKGFGWPGRGT